MHLVHSLDSSPLSLIWFVLLIDCFVNTELKGPQKLWWIFFIIITQFFGAILYFFLGPAQIYRYLVKKMHQPSQSPNNPSTRQPERPYYYPTQQRNYAPIPPSAEAAQRSQQDTPEYSNGYRAQESATPPAIQEPSSSDIFYEQPQAIYPEMTQEQK